MEHRKTPTKEHRLQPPLPLWQRIGVGVGLPAIFLLLVLYERRGGQGVPCLFYELTGLYCPGCGSGRSIVALLQGRYWEAFRQNVLLYPMGVPALLVLLHEYVRLVFPRLKLKPISVPQPVAVGCAAVLFLFAVLRNIPAFAFLAPY